MRGTIYQSLANFYKFRNREFFLKTNFETKPLLRSSWSASCDRDTWSLVRLQFSIAHRSEELMRSCRFACLYVCLSLWVTLSVCVYVCVCFATNQIPRSGHLRTCDIGCSGLLTTSTSKASTRRSFFVLELTFCVKVATAFCSALRRTSVIFSGNTWRFSRKVNNDPTYYIHSIVIYLELNLCLRFCSSSSKNSLYTAP